MDEYSRGRGDGCKAAALALRQVAEAIQAGEMAAMEAPEALEFMADVIIMSLPFVDALDSIYAPTGNEDALSDLLKPDGKEKGKAGPSNRYRRYQAGAK